MPALRSGSQMHVDAAELARCGALESLVMLDVDNFSTINKQRGSESGDAALAILEQLLATQAQWAYRTGGDQFALLQVDAGRVEELRNAFRVSCLKQLGFAVTLSGGGVHLDSGLLLPGAESANAMNRAASDLLALAKHHGRDAVLWVTDAEVEPDVETASVGRRLFIDLARINGSRARQMEIESRIDSLTGLYNRRGFDDIFGRLVERSIRSMKPIALISMDSDSLKKINDSRGHEAGDRFIVDLSTVLRSVVRRSDFIFRWGGDEFAVVLEPTQAAMACALGERIRAAVADRAGGTVSVGVYHGIPAGPAEAVRVADAAMYAAKGEGGDRVRAAAADNRQPGEKAPSP